MTPTINADENRAIEGLVAHFTNNRDRFFHLVDTLVSALQRSNRLQAVTHSLKWRVKDPDHLRTKLKRKMLAAKEAGRKGLGITTANLFSKVNDLGGVRLLHLHTDQFQEINRALLEVFDEYKYRLLEGPNARTWDDESREYFKGLGVSVTKSPTMYTSVHYVLRANSKTTLTCELQVRTLAEELWGEVDHALNYPKPNGSEECRELIRVLARLTSGSSRLVDAIFRADGNRSRAEQR